MPSPFCDFQPTIIGSTVFLLFKVNSVKLGSEKGYKTCLPLTPPYTIQKSSRALPTMWQNFV